MFPDLQPSLRGRSALRLLSTALLLLLPSSCTWGSPGSAACEPARPTVSLPPSVQESSGLAPSAARPDIVWTHNDSGGGARLIAVDSRGREVASVRLENGRNVDWEALERADCPEGSCLWIADTGDNQERRRGAALYRVVEPTVPDAADAVKARAFPIHFPDGPRDVEALFVLPGEDLYLVTKGREDPVTIYRYPPPLRPGEPVVLEEVQRLGWKPPPLARQVTGAATSPSGDRVVIRTYETLTFYRVRTGAAGANGEGSSGSDDRLLLPVRDGEVSLRSLREAQGEAVALAPDGRVLLTSEAGPGGRRGGLRVLHCDRRREAR